jgi:hypothetical protein
LKFLLSGEQEVDAFATDTRWRRRKPALALYPIGFAPRTLRKANREKQSRAK